MSEGKAIDCIYELNFEMGWPPTPKIGEGYRTRRGVAVPRARHGAQKRRV